MTPPKTFAEEMESIQGGPLCSEAELEWYKRGARWALNSEVVREMEAALNQHLEGTCHSCAAEFGAPDSAFDLPDIKETQATKKALESLRKAREGV